MSTIFKGFQDLYKLGNKVIPVIYHVDFSSSPHTASTHFNGECLHKTKTLKRSYVTATTDTLHGDALQTVLKEKYGEMPHGETHFIFRNKLELNVSHFIGFDSKDVSHLSSDEFRDTMKSHFVQENRNSTSTFCKLLTNVEDCTLMLEGNEIDIEVFSFDEIRMKWGDLVVKHTRIHSFSNGAGMNINEMNLGELDIIDAITEYKRYVTSIWEEQAESVCRFFL